MQKGRREEGKVNYCMLFLLRRSLLQNCFDEQYLLYIVRSLYFDRLLVCVCVLCFPPSNGVRSQFVLMIHIPAASLIHLTPSSPFSVVVLFQKHTEPMGHPRPSFPCVQLAVNSPQPQHFSAVSRSFLSLLPCYGFSVKAICFFFMASGIEEKTVSARAAIVDTCLRLFHSRSDDCYLCFGVIASMSNQARTTIARVTETVVKK